MDEVRVLINLKPMNGGSTTACLTTGHKVEHIMGVTTPRFALVAQFVPGWGQCC